MSSTAFRIVRSHLLALAALWFRLKLRRAHTQDGLSTAADARIFVRYSTHSLLLLRSHAARGGAPGAGVCAAQRSPRRGGVGTAPRARCGQLHLRFVARRADAAALRRRLAALLRCGEARQRRSGQRCDGLQPAHVRTVPHRSLRGAAWFNKPELSVKELADEIFKRWSTAPTPSASPVTNPSACRACAHTPRPARRQVCAGLAAAAREDRRRGEAGCQGA